MLTCLPVVRGRKLPGGFGVEVVPVAAMRVTGSLHHLMQFSGIECHDMFTVRTLKEVQCRTEGGTVWTEAITHKSLPSVINHFHQSQLITHHGQLTCEL